MVSKVSMHGAPGVHGALGVHGFKSAHGALGVRGFQGALGVQGVLLTTYYTHTIKAWVLEGCNYKGIKFLSTVLHVHFPTYYI